MNRFNNIVWTAVASVACAAAAIVLAAFDANTGIITAFSAAGITFAVLAPK